MRHCFKCKTFKELSEFYKDRSKPCGIGYVCKACVKIKDANRPSRKSRRHLKKRVGRYEYQLRYLKKYPEKHRARMDLHNAIDRGEIVRAEQCAQCGSGKRIEAHHPDYSRPLQVIWLCSQCHSKAHKRMRQLSQ